MTSDWVGLIGAIMIAIKLDTNSAYNQAITHTRMNALMNKALELLSKVRATNRLSLKRSLSDWHCKNF